jgi:hypothetical protein
VLSAETGNPIRRAQVRVNAAEVRTSRVAVTDSQGRYEFTGLPAARYQVQVSKGGYVTLEYGQARPFEGGKPLEIATGQSLDRVDFSLPRGSVIAGRITDEYGEPIADATVQALRYQYTNGARQLVPAGRASNSDDVGQFRIFGLMPGDYIVRASVRDNNAIAATMAGTEEPSGYPVTYYPGTTDPSQAQTVVVSLGQELGSVGFSLIPSRLARISGSVVSSQGQPLTSAVVVVRPVNGAGTGPLNIAGGNQVRADGSFSLSSVPPGEYSLDVQQRPRDMQSLAGELEFASIRLSVSGSDISGITIVTTPGVTVSGRVVMESQSGQKTSSRGVQVTAVTPGGLQPLMGIAGRMLGGGRVNGEDGAFQLRGLFGPQMIRVTGVPNGWALKTAVLEGENVTDKPYDFRSGSSISGMVVTLTDRLTEVTGSVRTAQGDPVKDYVVVVFAQDPALLGFQSRYVRAARPNQDGNFSLKGLPPAQYLAAVVDSLESGAQNDPAVLAQLRPQAQPFLLADGQRSSLDLVMPR